MGIYTKPKHRQIKRGQLFRADQQMSFPSRAWSWWYGTYTLDDMAQIFSDSDEPDEAKIWQWVKDGIIPEPVKLSSTMYLWCMDDFVGRELPDEILDKITAYDKYVNEQLDIEYGIAGAGQTKLC